MALKGIKGGRRELDLTNKRFGKLTAIKKTRIKCRYWMWECKCDCGNILETRGSRLVEGRVKSCGCYRKETIGNMASNQCGEDHPNWKGGKWKDPKNGYIYVHIPGHPRSNSWGYVAEHILKVEKVLGKYLDNKFQIHHLNGKRDDNENKNLVVCDSDGYHKFLHRRKRAFDACGKANYKQCLYCKEYGDPEELRHGKLFYHEKCKIKKK